MGCLHSPILLPHPPPAFLRSALPPPSRGEGCCHIYLPRHAGRGVCPQLGPHLTPLSWAANGGPQRTMKKWTPFKTRKKLIETRGVGGRRARVNGASGAGRGGPALSTPPLSESPGQSPPRKALPGSHRPASPWPGAAGLPLTCQPSGKSGATREPPSAPAQLQPAVPDLSRRLHQQSLPPIGCFSSSAARRSPQSSSRAPSRVSCPRRNRPTHTPGRQPVGR